MTKMTSRGKADRLLRIFERNGHEGPQTRPFYKLPEMAQKCMLDAVNLASAELPVLASFRSDAQWILITSERVIFVADGVERSLLWSEIDDVTIDPDFMRSAGGKTALRYLIIVCGGERVLVEIEPGPPFFGLWNVLKAVSRLG